MTGLLAAAQRNLHADAMSLLAPYFFKIGITRR